MSDKVLTPINDISSRAFDELFSRYQGLDTECLLIYIFDSVNESALIHLAEQFHITGNEGWINCQTVEEKRNLIKNSLNLHRFKGTKYALIRVLDILGLNGKVEEWFEYEGNPYYFKVSLTSFNFSSDNTLLNNLIDLINEYKNVRSHLESIELNIASKTQEKVKVALGLVESRFCVYNCTSALDRN